jgi:hypothetical protein
LISAATSINDNLKKLKRTDSTVATDGEALSIAMSLTSKLQEQYKEVKWLLTDSSSNNDYVTEAHTLAEEDITPINHYFDLSIMDKKKSYKRYCDVSPGSYGVWVSDGDVMVGASSYSIADSGEKSYGAGSSFANGEVSGIIIAKGDVTFADDVTRFNGLIVSGGKIIVNNFGKNNTMTFSADANLVKRILSACDMSRGEKDSSNFGFVCDMFREFVSEYVPETESGDAKIEREISGVQFEDVLSFNNWKKNVD